jgi:DNA-binding GntR family transcriptional regulator
MTALDDLPALEEGHPQSRKVTVSGRVHDVVRDAIVQLRFSPGSPLSEADVARRLGVSRQPVREAFIKLAEAGLLEIRPQRGTYVRKISVREVANARFIREAIEVAIVRKAAAETDTAALRQLESLLDAQRRAADAGDHAGFLRLDEAFHQGLAQAADCADAWRVLEGLKAQMDRVRYLSLPDATPMLVLIEQHRAILDRVAAGDPAGAEAAVHRHLSEIQTSLPRISRLHPELFSP